MNTLRQALVEYLATRRALGFKLKLAGAGLLDFVAFMERRRASYITNALALAWAKQPKDAQPASWAGRLCYVRGFARYRSASDSRTQIPPARLLPFRPKRARPYLYSDKEIKQLLEATLNMPLAQNHQKNSALLPWVYYCLFGLLSVSGLRPGEARNLELRDVDLTARVLTIRGGKFGKDRIVPVHASTCEVLADYIARRQRHWAGRPVSTYLFVSSRGNRLSRGRIHLTFCAASRKSGLRGASDSHGPRLHDFRHRLASEALWRWYRAGEEPERRLPVLSAFLGHAHWSDTFWYLSATPGLMRDAIRRLDRHWKRRI
jgi:integrase